MKNLLFYIVFGLIVAVVFLAIGASLGSHPVIALRQQVTRLQNGWNEAITAQGSTQDINDRLTAEASDLRKENKRRAQQVASLQAQLAELTGSGPAEVDQPRTLAKYEDQNVSIRYHLISEDFDYTLKPRKITLAIVENDNKVSAKAWDVLADREIAIDKLDFLRLPNDYKPWYKKVKLGLGAGYSDGIMGGVVVGYNKTRIFGGARLDETLVPTVMVLQDFW